MKDVNITSRPRFESAIYHISSWLYMIDLRWTWIYTDEENTCPKTQVYAELDRKATFRKAVWRKPVCFVSHSDFRRTSWAAADLLSNLFRLRTKRHRRSRRRDNIYLAECWWMYTPRLLTQMDKKLPCSIPSGGLTFIVWTQKWGFSCEVQKQPHADMFLNESLLPPKTPLRTPCSWPPWPWFSREKSLKIRKKKKKNTKFFPRPKVTLAACSQLHASGLWPLFLGRALSALRSIGFTQSTCGWA
jgi:hypothetical protein